MSEDMHSAYASGLVTKGAKEGLVKFQKALRNLPVKKLLTDTIPTYSLKEFKDLESCLTSLGKQVISPFVEVTVKGHVVLLTAIWFFQETFGCFKFSKLS